MYADIHCLYYPVMLDYCPHLYDFLHMNHVTLDQCFILV